MMHASTEKVRKQTSGCMMIDGDAILHTCVEIHNVYFGIVYKICTIHERESCINLSTATSISSNTINLNIKLRLLGRND